MDDLLAARLQMAFSLGFHIVFACIGMVMPFFMSVAHFYWLKTKKAVYRDVTKAWSKGVAIFFATGAVSGTVLSFELGLLWPKFMEHAGPIFGMPFSLEGTAFFIEAIALGFYLYGWNKLDPWFPGHNPPFCQQYPEYRLSPEVHSFLYENVLPLLPASLAASPLRL